ncbi:MAG TPA: hypothetical protein VF493_22675 [Terriglobales bacterium]
MASFIEEQMGQKYGWKDGYVSPAKRRFWAVIPALGLIGGIVVERIWHYQAAVPVGLVCGLLLGFVVAALRGKDEL